MPEENQVTPPPSGDNPWEQTFKEGDLPRRNEISIGVITRKVDKFVASQQSWEAKDVVKAIKEDIEFEEPILRAPVEIATGNQPVLAISSQQSFAVRAFFEVPAGSNSPLYALIESVGAEPKRTEVVVKTIFVKPKTIDHLIVSEESARQLGINPQAERNDIRVLEMYQKIEDIDLDKL